MSTNKKTDVDHGKFEHKMSLSNLPVEAFQAFQEAVESPGKVVPGLEQAAQASKDYLTEGGEGMVRQWSQSTEDDENAWVAQIETGLHAANGGDFADEDAVAAVFQRFGK